MRDRNRKENSICTFIHYSTTNTVPYHVQIYINQLSIFFEKVVALTNNQSLNPNYNKLNSNVSFWFDQNMGYDFGLFYRFSKKHNLLKYNTVGIVNDSNLLLNSLHEIFEWSNNLNVDFWGVIDSNEQPWFSEHNDNYHIQSHFVVLNKVAISFLPELFDSINLDSLFLEKDPKKLRRLVINNWEIKLSQFLIQRGLKCASYVDSQDFLNRHNSSGKNATIELYGELIKEGYPFLKQKITNKSSWRKYINRREPWENSIHENIHPGWNVEKIINSVKY